MVEIARTILHPPDIILWQSPESKIKELAKATPGDILGLTFNGKKREFYGSHYGILGIYACVYLKPQRHVVSFWTMAYSETDPFKSDPHDFARLVTPDDINTIARIPASIAIPHESGGKLARNSAATVNRGNGTTDLVLIEASFDCISVGRAYPGYRVIAPTSNFAPIDDWFDSRLKVW